jgi:hypothetical protein
LVPFS